MCSPSYVYSTRLLMKNTHRSQGVVWGWPQGETQRTLRKGLLGPLPVVETLLQEKKYLELRGFTVLYLIGTLVVSLSAQPMNCQSCSARFCGQTKNEYTHERQVEPLRALPGHAPSIR